MYVCISCPLKDLHSELSEMGTGLGCFCCLCPYVSASVNLCGQICEYVYAYCGSVVCVCVLTKDTSSASLLAGPSNTALWQPHLCQTAGFGNLKHIAENFLCIWYLCVIKLNVINSYKLTEKGKGRFQSVGSDENFSYTIDNFLKQQNSKGSFCVL